MVLIALLSAGMAAQVTAFLERNWLTALDSIVRDSSWLLSDSSLLGKALHAAHCLAILAATLVPMRMYGAPTKAAQPARGQEPDSVA